MTPAARRFWVRGRVQGVGFRYATQTHAAGLGLTGWVRNLPDGRVEVFAEGEEAGVRALEAWLDRGPRFARVDELYSESAETEAGSAFEIRR